MISTSFLHRRPEVLERLLTGYRKEGDSLYRALEPTALDACTIALAREPGTPVLEVARQVSERLGWPVYDRELPAQIALELQVPVAAVEEIDERQRSWLLECVESFSSQGRLNESRYFRHLIALVRALGEQGRCLIVGHGAAFLLPPQSTLRVCLVADRRDRIAALSRALDIDRATAAHRLEEIQRENSRFLSTHFHVDPTQPGHYDLVLNCSRWSPTDCADFILGALEHKASGHPSM